MAVISFCSAGGAPGVSTTALALALGWHRPNLFIEADPAGASALAGGYFRGEFVPPHNIVELGASYVRNTMYDDLPRFVVPVNGSQTRALFGTRTPEQARSLSQLWEPLTQLLIALEKNGQDVLVDAGRLGMENSPTPLIEGADLCLLLLRSDLRSVVAARAWADDLVASYSARGVSDRIRLLLVGERAPYSAADVEKALGIPVLASIEDDPTLASTFSRGIDPGPKYAKSKLGQSYTLAGQAIAAHINSTRQRLGLNSHEL